MGEKINKHLLSCGIQASYMLSEDEDFFLVYEHVGKYLYTKLKKPCAIEILNFYVIDEKGENFQSEVVSDSYGTRQGYDVISVQEYKKKISDISEVIHSKSYKKLYSIFPLYCSDQLIGLLEFHHSLEMDKELLDSIILLSKSLAVGLQNRLLSRSGMIRKQTIEMVIDIAKNLQTITSIDELATTFAKLIAQHMIFDRVTLFLFDENHKIKLSRCMDCNGKELSVNHIPNIPDLGNSPESLDRLSGYWYPLYTNARQVGVALFDNIYSAYPFPEWNRDVLLSLCSQFAIAVENISLFSGIKAAARKDKLTNLYNRAYLDEVLVALEKQLPLSIIIGDANGLKVTNDVFGHLEGDKILISIANILTSNCKKTDIIARWGGDEFLVLLPKTNATEMERICNRIQEACKKETSFMVDISITLGYGTKTKEEEEFITVLKRAEDMMYFNKQIDREQFNANFLNSINKYMQDHCDEGKEHIDALSSLALKFGIILGLSELEINYLYKLCLFHDIGKIGVSEDLLKKETKLSEEEWELVKKHSSIGSRIAHSALDIACIKEEILSLHEKWDGTGYPQGIRELEIPKLARIFAIVETYVVMTQGRAYRKPCSHSMAIKEIKTKAGTQFDPELVNRFICNFEL